MIAASYDQRAAQHRPQGAQLEAEIRRLHAAGLTARDIAVALRLQLDLVVNVLAERPP
jgi:hypothetical protein